MKVLRVTTLTIKLAHVTRVSVKRRVEHTSLNIAASVLEVLNSLKQPVRQRGDLELPQRPDHLPQLAVTQGVSLDSSDDIQGNAGLVPLYHCRSLLHSDRFLFVCINYQSKPRLTSLGK